MLISIKEADYEYCYGIFLNKLTKATIYLKRAFIKKKILKVHG